ncbi:hypothetical protein BKA93DRAFT_739411 [Sparassis latifolia]
MLDGFFKKLQELPILTPHSSEYNTFKDIIGDAEHCITSHRKTKPAPSNPSPNVHPVPIASSSTPSTYSPELCRLLKFVKDLLSLCLETSPSSPTHIQAHILKDLDKFFPFCEHAPSKLSVSGLNGPLHPNNINKPGGFASVLCWHGVTFGCKAVVEKEVFFPDLEAFQAMCRSCPSDDPKFLCKKTAYGSAIGGCGPEHAPAYFAVEKEWKKLFDDPSMVDANGQLRFTTFYQWTQSANLPQMGPLIGMLLAGDLCHAGKFRMPSAEEMGTLVSAVNKGAVSGLQYCSLLPDTYSRAEVVQAFKVAYNFLDTMLAEEEKVLITFNVIMVEHLLCKIQRSSKYIDE